MPKVFTVEEYVGYDRFEGKKSHQPVEIPDGQWVAFASSGASWCYPDDPEDRNVVYESRTYSIVGHMPTRRIVLDRSRSGGVSDGSSYSHVALVGDAPFGVIFEEKEGCERRDGLYFSCARQVHKGELGQRPKICRPQFAREAPAYEMPAVSALTGQPIANRDRRRGKKNGWCRLVDLAGFVEMKPHEVVLRYFPFTHAEFPRLDVVIAARRKEIHCQKIPRDRILQFAEPTAETKSVMDLFRHHNVDHLWVRQGWALTVLYLAHFGYIPSLRGEMAPPWRPVAYP